MHQDAKLSAPELASRPHSPTSQGPIARIFALWKWKDSDPGALGACASVGSALMSRLACLQLAGCS